MEKRKNIFCARVSGNKDNLNRVLLREEFSKFGNVTKIFIDADITYAKVYLDNAEDLRSASTHLNGLNNWKIRAIRDDYYKSKDLEHNSDYKSLNTSRTSFNQSLGATPRTPLSRSFGASSRTSLNQSVSATPNGTEDMDEECVYAGNYVDVHGRPVEVLQAENGVLFVNLDDVRAGGYSIYKKESFDKATISEDIQLRHLENFLLDQGKKYILNEKKKFDEQELVDVFERVRAKLENKSAGDFSEGRSFNATPNTKNITITASSTPSTSAASGNRVPKELAANYQPTFSHLKTKPNRDSQIDDDRPSSRNSTQSDSRRPYDNREGNRQDNREDNRQENRRDDRNGFKKDYRNEDKRIPVENSPDVTDVSQNDMRKPKQSLESILSKGTAPNSANEESDESFKGTKKPLPNSKLQDGSLSGHSQPPPLHVERITLAPQMTYKVKVSYIKPDKALLFYSQHLEDLNEIEEILLRVNTKDLELPEIVAPARNMLCIAFFEGCWYRAVVVHEKSSSGGTFVELIDYGNKENIKTPLREMSTEMKKIPGMAIRTAVHAQSNINNNNLIFKTEQVLEVFVKKHISDGYDDLTHLVEIKRVLDDQPASPSSGMSSDQEQQQPSTAADEPATDLSENCFTEIPPSSAKLVNGESVLIVSYTSTNFILRNKETAKNCKAVYTHLATMEKKPIVNPKVGQMVLCSRDGMEGMHRAVIKQINNLMATLEYLDYYGEESLSLKSLRNVDKVLAAYPNAKLESPIIDWLKEVTDKSELFLADLIVNKTKLKVILDSSKFDLVLPGDTEILLSEKIKQLENPPQAIPKVPVACSTSDTSKNEVKTQLLSKKEETVAKVNSNDDPYIKISYDDMPFAKAQLGEQKYICYNCKNDFVTLLSSNDAAEYLEQLVILEPKDSAPHMPELYEMCLGKFEEAWFRAVLTDSSGETCEVLFVDFGNTESIPKSDVRKFPREFAKIPILGINAYFINIPKDPKVYKRLKELVPDEEELTINVKIDLNDDLKYGIEAPSVYEKLRNENLI